VIEVLSSVCVLHLVTDMHTQCAKRALTLLAIIDPTIRTTTAVAAKGMNGRTTLTCEVKVR
jgi:hypothetical protein